MTPDIHDKSTWKTGWQMRDGTPVEILADDMGGLYPVLCRWKMTNENWTIAYRKANGWHLDNVESDADLIPRPVKHSGWVLIARPVDASRYVAYCSQLCRTHAEALRFKGSNHDLACIRIEFQEGEGLT